MMQWTAQNIKYSVSLFTKGDIKGDDKRHSETFVQVNAVGHYEIINGGCMEGDMQ